MDTSKSYVRDGRIQQKPRGNYFLFSFLKRTVVLAYYTTDR